MITGKKIDRPTKKRIAQDIASHLGLQAPHEANGSSIDSAFLDEVQTALTGAPTGGHDTYRKTEQLLATLGRTYDPYWDTSEAADKGGGTVTTRAFSRIRTAVTEVPRCFILNVTDAPVGTRWEHNHDKVYRYDDTVTGRMPLNDGGPESRVIYYSTRKSQDNRMKFVATATVGYIDPGWDGPWEARLQDYQTFPTPVPVAELDLQGWNRRHAITEIPYDTYRALVEAGGLELDPQPSPAQPGAAGHDDLERPDPGGSEVAERVLKDFPVDGLVVPIDIPEVLPAAAPAVAPIVQPSYVETPDGVANTQPNNVSGRKTQNKSRDKLAEKRAIDLTKKAMADEGWPLHRDRQQDGVGYDLEFKKGDRNLKVEVKGIQGSQLAFNLTPKEFWRAETDPEWIVVAVTSVLSPTEFKLNVLTRDTVLAGTRTITGYRMTL